jgi:hypothetical protein
MIRAEFLKHVFRIVNPTGVARLESLVNRFLNVNLMDQIFPGGKRESTKACALSLTLMVRV